MKAKPYFPYGINLNLKFSGAVVARGQHLKEGCAYCRGRELNHIKFQHWSWWFKWNLAIGKPKNTKISACDCFIVFISSWYFI